MELTINVKKTEILHINSPNIPREGMIKIPSHNLDCIHTQNATTLWKDCQCETYLNQVKAFKYLGVILDENLNWTNHIDTLCKKFILCAMKLNNLKWLVPPKIMLTIYYALVSSIINYGIGVWGLASSTHISKV